LVVSASSALNDAPGVEQDDVGDALGDQDVGAGDARGARTRDDDTQRMDVPVENLHRTLQRGKHDDCRAVLVVVHHGAVQRLDDTALDLEAARRRDVLEVHRAE
jgi:hypothetical protein